MKEMGGSPSDILQKLIDTAISLCKSHSAGLSLVEKKNGQTFFRWHATAGQWSPYVGSKLPRYGSPCGTVLDLNCVLHMVRPEQHYPFPPEISPAIAEVLLVPFHMGGIAVGTIWIIAHDDSRQFDREDERLMTNLAAFAGSAYQLMTVAQDLSLRLAERIEAEENMKLMLHELNHRARNLLAVVQAVARLTPGEEDARTFAGTFSARLRGLAASHTLVADNNWEGVELGGLVRLQLAHLSDLIGTRIHIEGPILRLTPAAAQSIGMALHELATNAAKYGALSTDAGSVTVAWTASSEVTPPGFDMRWQERDGPPVRSPTHEGFGRVVIARMIEQALDATVSLDYAAAGLTWQVQCAASNVTVEQVSRQLEESNVE